MNIKELFKLAVTKNASDLHLIVENPPLLRIDGVLQPISQTEALNNVEAKNLFFSILTKEEQNFLVTNKDIDMAYELEDGHRFRINIHLERGNFAMSARVILSKIPTLEQLDAPDVVSDLVRLRQGLIIVTGPSGQGKSTTLAAMINLINKERKEHIITLEDPIEFIFKNQKSFIEQRQLGGDMASFSSGLKHVVRQDPNVIMIGEIRDLESISSVLTLAETGHLVLTTLHTPSASQSIDRIIDVFPAHQQNQVRLQMSMVLSGIVSQRLLSKKKKGRVAAYEILLNMPAIANLIREKKTNQIDNIISTSSSVGMVSMKQSIKKLVKDDIIGKDIEKKFLNKITNIKKW